MGLEQKVNESLRRHPGIRRGVKRVYQGARTAAARPPRAEGEITRISPRDPAHDYFFGYYDQCPEDRTGRYALCLRADCAWKEPAPLAPATLLLIDLEKAEGDPARVREIGTTRAWNVQMGCRAQWLGPEFERYILYNDYRDGKWVAVIRDIQEDTERTLPLAAYAVSGDGRFALTLDFARLHRLRPGYGYANQPDGTAGEKVPTAPAVTWMDLETGETRPVLTYERLLALAPRPEMDGAEHKVNHLMIAPSGQRFMVLHRWLAGGRKWTRLVTANIDGSDPFVLSDDDMVSHCWWVSDAEILAFEHRKEGGNGYYLMRDRTEECRRLWPDQTADGHPSCSPDGRRVVFDTYPNAKRVARLYVTRLTVGSIRDAGTPAKVFAPFRYDNDTRCDLHPRWSRDGQALYFDSCHEGRRGLYRVPAGAEEAPMDQGELVSVVIPTYKRSETLLRAVDSALGQTWKNLEVLVVDDNNPEDEYSLETRTRVAGIADPRVRLVTQEKHVNGNVARNAGIRAAAGEYVAFLDDDDIWYPEKIEKQMRRLREEPGAGLCYTGSRAVYVNDGVAYPILPKQEGDLSRTILKGNCIGTTSTVVVRRELLEKVGGFDPEMPALQDFDLWIRLCRETRVAAVKTPQIDYFNFRAVRAASDGAQVSANTGKYEQAFARINEKYADALATLTPAEKKQRQDYEDLLLANKALRNNDPKTGRRYLRKALKRGFHKKAAALYALSPFGYGKILKLRKFV